MRDVQRDSGFSSQPQSPPRSPLHGYRNCLSINTYSVRSKLHIRLLTTRRAAVDRRSCPTVSIAIVPAHIRAQRYHNQVRFLPVYIISEKNHSDTLLKT